MGSRDGGPAQGDLHSIVVRPLGLLTPCVRVHVGEGGGLAVYAARGDHAGGALEEAGWGEPGVKPAPAARLLYRAVSICPALGVCLGILFGESGLLENEPTAPAEQFLEGATQICASS